MKKIWKDISIGDKFTDGSKVESIHGTYESECYKITYKPSLFKKAVEVILSKDHLLLFDISKNSKELQEWIRNNYSDYEIPTLFDKHLFLKEEMLTSGVIEASYDELFEAKYSIVSCDKVRVSDNEFWLPMEVFFEIFVQTKQHMYCNGHELSIEYAGVRNVFCVETDSHKFETCGLIHHNSVTLRDVIFHCLTHSDKIALALVDVKVTEFEPFKGIKGVVAVANEIPEIVELLKVAKKAMYKRNKELAAAKINDIVDYKPKKPTNKYRVCGREFDENQMFDIRLVDGTEKTVPVKELEKYLS